MLSSKERKILDASMRHPCKLPETEDILARYIDSGLFVNLRRKLKRFLICSEKSPRTRLYVLSKSAINLEISNHLRYNYRMIHPFSIFRFAWEALMSVVFLILLTTTPIRPLFARFTYIPRIFADVFSVVDIILTFRTGFQHDATKKIIMSPDSIRKRVLSYFQFRFNRNFFKESEILGNLSNQLRQEIIFHTRRELFTKSVMFRDLPDALLLRMGKVMKMEIFLPNDVVVSAGHHADVMYFMVSGMVAVYNTLGKEVCHLGDGSYFGEAALFSNDRIRLATVVAIDFCEMYTLSQEEFAKTVAPYPDLLERILKISNDRLKQFLEEENLRSSLRRGRKLARQVLRAQSGGAEVFAVHLPGGWVLQDSEEARGGGVEGSSEEGRESFGLVYGSALGFDFCAFDFGLSVSELCPWSFGGGAFGLRHHSRAQLFPPQGQREDVLLQLQLDEL